jgi:hypothetical protein
VLLIFAQRRCANDVQVAARKRGLEHVAGIHGALGGAGAYHGVYLVDKEQHLALGALDLFHDGFEALLKLAAVLGAGNERAQVERHEVFVAQDSGTSPMAMRAPGPSAMAVLPTPASPMSIGLFLVRRLKGSG